MAISRTIKTSSGMIVEDAYIKIINIDVNNSEKLLFINAGVYTSKDFSKFIPMDYYSYNLTLDQIKGVDGVDFFEKSYNYMKSLKEFTGCKDV